MNTHTKTGKGCTFFTLVLSLFFSACTLGPNFTEPITATPDAYRTQIMPADPINDLQWWELFKDPLLYSLVTTALENNRDVKIAISRIEQARANLGFVRADQYPRVDIDAGATTGNFSGGTRSEDTNSTVYLAAPLSWELDFWGKFSRSTEAARAELMASEYGLKTIQLTLIAEVVTNYYQLLDFHRRLNISEETLASRIESLNIIQQRFNKGIIAELDVNQAQIQKEIAAAAIPLYKRSIAKTENNLSILLGRLPSPIVPEQNLGVNFQAPKIPVGLPPAILERRPDISQAKYLLKAQTENIGVAEALRWPAISLTGTLGVASSELSSITIDGGVWSVGGRLLGPLFDFNKNKRRVEIQEQKTKEALFQYENVVLTAFREVDDALMEIATYRNELAAIDRQLKASQNATNLSKERYDKGVSSYLEVLDTERTLFSTDLQQSQLQQQYLNAYVNLYKALGGGWITKADRNHKTSPVAPTIF
ncbi:efflux transporter outer membrane subunit [Desulfogranum marinum]|uniref:efflux transporter outer membrane subunit n=1 Tax=Desulfogranum marinum TaxID=453220 RepID=UPI001966B6F5|nr:TolC family protein [Desulfogranum marinum]MBM9513833.1 TolC family protein [Desulfogranum marinum]